MATGATAVTVTTVLAAIAAAEQLATTLIPNLIALAQAIKAGASETDIAALDAAIAKLQPINDAAFARVDAKLAAAAAKP